MIIWDDAQTTSQKLAQDTNAANVTFLNLMMNQGYKEVLSELGRPVTEKTSTAITTVAGQQAYRMPADLNWLKSFQVTVGSTTYTPDEEESQENWNLLNMQARSGDIPETIFVRPNFGVGGTEVLIYPIPSTSSNTITVVYEALERDLSIAKYTTGTVTLTNGSTTVTGAGTTFTAAMVGRYIQSSAGDGLWYRIASFTSTTVLTLETKYLGATTAGLNFQIAEAFGLPEDLHMLPIYFAVWHYSLFRRDKTRSDEYGAYYVGGLQKAKRIYGTKSRGNIIKGDGRLNNRSSDYPRNFPMNIT
jgi:hypothetical protein